MIKIARFQALSIVFISLAGCQAAMYGTAADFNKIDVGMSKEQVVARLGEASSSEADALKGEQRLIYKRMAYIAGWSPTMYEVVLREGKVVTYGERRSP